MMKLTSMLFPNYAEAPLSLPNYSQVQSSNYSKVSIVFHLSPRVNFILKLFRIGNSSPSIQKLHFHPPSLICMEFALNLCKASFLSFVFRSNQNFFLMYSSLPRVITNLFNIQSFLYFSQTYVHLYMVLMDKSYFNLFNVFTILISKNHNFFAF